MQCLRATCRILFLFIPKWCSSFKSTVCGTAFCFFFYLTHSYTWTNVFPIAEINKLTHDLLHGIAIERKQVVKWKITNGPAVKTNTRCSDQQQQLAVVPAARMQNVYGCAIIHTWCAFLGINANEQKKQNKTHTQTISVYNSWQVFNSLIHSETETSLLENNNAHVYNLYRWIAHARLIHCLVSCRVQLIQWSVASRHNSCFPATTRSKKDSHSQRWQQECGRATLFWRY